MLTKPESYVIAYREEEVRDIVGDVDGNSHVGEMETVAQSDQSQSDDVVADELHVVLPRFLQLQQKHDRLLRPVTSLEQVVRLEQRRVLAMREPLEHGGGVEIPDVGLAHHVQTEGTEDAEVHGRVHLFHEPRGLTLAADPAGNSHGSNHALHYELPSKGQNNHVERDESNVLGAFSVHDRTVGGRRSLGIGQEDRAVHRVGRSRVHGVRGEKDDQHQEGKQPCVFQAEIFEAAEGGSGLAAFRLRLGLFGTRLEGLTE